MGGSIEKSGNSEDHARQSLPRKLPRVYEHHQHRGYERNIKKESDKNSDQEHSVYKYGKSSLNSKQEKCDNNYKAQSEVNKVQSEEKEHQLYEYRDISRRFDDEFNRSHGQSKRSHSYRRSYGYSEKYSPSKRYDGHSKRVRAYPERSHGHSEKCRTYRERSYDHAWRSHGQSERYGQSERNQPSYSLEEIMESPIESITQPKRNLLAERRNDYFYIKLSQANRRENMNQGVTQEDEENSYKAPSYVRYVYADKRILAKRVRYSRQRFMYQPRGVFLKFNFGALGNQTEILLSDRSSQLAHNKARRNLH